MDNKKNLKPKGKGEHVLMLRALKNITQIKKKYISIVQFSHFHLKLFSRYFHEMFFAYKQQI